jgi:hypothetical protein
VVLALYLSATVEGIDRLGKYWVSGVFHMVIEGKFSDYFLDPKNVINRSTGLFALIFCAPLLVSIAIALKFGCGGPVFLVERRHLSDKGMYDAWRFRMSQGEDQSLICAFLCESRLELLPQLVNVVRGDLSIAAVLQ